MSTSESDVTLHNRLTRWYAASRRPDLLDLLGKLDAMVARWADDEAGLTERMTRLFGDEPPPATQSVHERATVVLTRCDPPALSILDTDLEAHTGREEEWLLRLQLRHMGSDAFHIQGADGIPTSPSRSAPGRVQYLEGCRWKAGDPVCGRFPPVTGRERRGVVVSLNTANSVNVRWADGTNTHGVDPLLLQDYNEGDQQLPSAYEEIEVRAANLHRREQQLIKSEDRLLSREDELLAWARHFGVSDSGPPEAVLGPTGMLPGGGEGEGLAPLEARQAMHANRTRLQRFYKKYCPGQLPLVDEMLEGASGHEEELFSALVRRHGPEPPAPGAGPPPPLQHDLYRRRLQRFYTYYNPSQLLVVDQMLAAASGNEERMFAALVNVHGPEPPSEDVCKIGGIFVLKCSNSW